MLEERITTKANICNSLPPQRQLWLALLDQYFVADTETYHHAMLAITNTHRFEKILLVSCDRSVTVLFEKVIRSPAGGVMLIGGTFAVVIAGAAPGAPPRGVVRTSCDGGSGAPVV